FCAVRVDKTQLPTFPRFSKGKSVSVCLRFLWLWMLLGEVSNIFAQTNAASFLMQPWKPWIEVRTGHFCIYSCAATQEVYKVAGRLEQFRDAYSLLAGAQAVASPPIIVMAYPDVMSMRPYIPLYNGKPLSVQGFFRRGSDQNVIVMALS